MNCLYLSFGKSTKYLISYQHSHFINLSDGDYVEVFDMKILTVTKSLFGHKERLKTHKQHIGNHMDIGSFCKHWDNLIKNKTPI